MPPGDLGQSMGNASPAEVRNLMSQVVPRIRAAGKNVGVGGNSPSDAAGVAEFIKLGANFVTVSAWGCSESGPRTSAAGCSRNSKPPSSKPH